VAFAKQTEVFFTQQHIYFHMFSPSQQHEIRLKSFSIFTSR